MSQKQGFQNIEFGPLAVHFDPSKGGRLCGVSLSVPETKLTYQAHIGVSRAGLSFSRAAIEFGPRLIVEAFGKFEGKYQFVKIDLPRDPRTPLEA